MRNAIFTVCLVEFFFLWNDLLIALTFTNSDNLRTLQVGLLNFTGEYGSVDYGPLFAAICVSVIGTLILYRVLNQRIMRGLSSGAVKAKTAIPGATDAPPLPSHVTLTRRRSACLP